MPVPSIKAFAGSRDPDYDFYHVRFREPSRFSEVRTPGWAARVAQSVSDGAKVRMGRTPAGNWLVQSVLIKKTVPSALYAMNKARRIVREVES
jgi:hypothetical protein